MRKTRFGGGAAFVFLLLATAAECEGAAAEWWKPYSPPCVERENVFQFTEKPSVKLVGKDRYEITFAVASKGGSSDGGYCDVTVSIVDPDPAKERVKGRGVVVRHLASGVLGRNAPPPFQKDSVAQKIYWNGKNDLDEYVRAPETLVVRVSLGLKPEYAYRLGGRSPHNLPGYVCGIAVGPEGAVVFSKYWRLHARKFDLNGEYIMSLWPPPANLPEEKLTGMGYVEYEPGKKALQSPTLYDTVSDRGWMFWGVDHGGLVDVQPALFGDRVYFVGFNGEVLNSPAPIYYLKLDGSTDFAGVHGVPFSLSQQKHPRLAASPDGKWLYMTGAGSEEPLGVKSAPILLRRAREGNSLAEVLVGKDHGKGHRGMLTASPGSDNESLNGPAGIDCDVRGRVYVCDHMNNRVQVFLPDGKHLKTVPISRPILIRVHQKTGAIYVVHHATVQGRTVGRITKLESLENPRVVFHQDGQFGLMFALDSWSPKPRLWLAGGGSLVGAGSTTALTGMRGGLESVTIYEDEGTGLRKIMNFDERAAADDGPHYYGRWRDEHGGSGGSTRIDCDPVRERVYYHTNLMFDLPTGKFLGWWNATNHRTIIEDIAFDRRGYMHIHFNPDFYLPGVGRVDPSRPIAYKHSDFGGHAEYYPEVPYDYGIEDRDRGGRGYWKGILPVKDQGGTHAFQCGLGVSMCGEVAVQSYIYYVPKMEDTLVPMFNEGADERRRMYNMTSVGGTSENPVYASFMKRIQDQAKTGEAVYFIRRRPGVPLHGGTVWTYDATGELRGECAATVGGHMDGVEIDEDRNLYFMCSYMRTMPDQPGVPFLHGRGGTFGGPPVRKNRYPMTGTLIKTREKDVSILLAKAVVPVEPLPDRPPDLIASGYESERYEKATWAWAEGAHWMYAGASPIRFRACNCPSPRFGLDWYKRVFVPEGYRHSVAILDTSGNLVHRIGRYGNFDSADGPASKIPVGGDNIGVFHPRAVSASDNYIVFSSWEEWVQVLKIGYHAEETIPIRLSVAP